MKSSPKRHGIVVAWVLFLGIRTAFAQFPGGPPQNLPPLEERRAAVLKRYDVDHDGRLSADEREKAREGWRKQMLAQREDRNFFRPPPELMEEFDKNKDGELDDEEGQTLRETLARRFEKLNRDYDKNGNGRLEEDEITAASKDIDSGTLKGIPKMFLQMFRGGPRGRPGMRGPGGPGGPGRPGAPGGPGGPGEDSEDENPSSILRRADRDGDGRLSEAELAVVRAAWEKRRAAKATGAEAR